MKTFCLCLFSIALLPESSFSQSLIPDGKTFAITLFIKSERDSRDTLLFKNNSMQFATAKKYGFVTENIKTKEKNGSVNFTVVCKSKKNGDMIWDGKVMNDSIAGTLIWDRMLENPVNYTFTGNVVKE